jgi:hypothetical protein
MEPARRAPLVALLLFGAVFLFAACAATRLGPLPAVGDDAATLVVIRPWRFVAGGGRLVVAVDDVPVALLGNDEHVVVAVAPGQRVVGLGYGSRLFGYPGDVNDYAATTVAVAPRSTHYYRVEPNLGVPALNELTPAAAQSLLATTTRVTGRPRSD